jgi:hypothetical protein
MQHLFDPLLAWADITTVATETGLRVDILERMYKHWIDVHPADDTVGGATWRDREDRLSGWADVAAVAAETGLSHELVTRIHERLVRVRGKSPTREDLGRYAAYGAERLGEGGFRLYLGMPADPAHLVTPSALALLEVVAAKAEVWRRWRRPRTWTKGEFRLRYIDASLLTTPPYTPRRVAPHFVTLAGKRGIDLDHLRSLIRRFGVPHRIDWRTTGDRG